jgi:hypothetical protein
VICSGFARVGLLWRDLPVYFPVFRFLETRKMAITAKPGQTVRVTINKTIKREGARKTLERLFLQDRKISDPLDARSKNFKELPKRRGGQIWTKRPNKLHPVLDRGVAATFKLTPQSVKDLNSVAEFVEVAAG